MLVLTQACSFSASSKGSESSSDSSASSSRSSSPESAESQYKSDVREYTAAYVKTGGQFDAFRRGIGDLAKKQADGRGATLWAGLKGALFSLPELFFQNIRKVSFEHVRRGGQSKPFSHPTESPGGG